MQELLSLPLKNNVLNFEVIEGGVVGEKKWAETHVYSSGGSGYVGPRGGYVNMPTVKNNVVTRHSFWIKENGTGKEIPVDLCGQDVPLREEQEVALVVADTGEHQYPVILVNYPAKQFHFLIVTQFRNFVLKAAKIQKIQGDWLILGAVLSYFFIDNFFLKKWLCLILGVSGLFRFIQWFQGVKASEKTVKAHFEQLAHALLMKKENAQIIN